MRRLLATILGLTVWAAVAGADERTAELGEDGFTLRAPGGRVEFNLGGRVHGDLGGARVGDPAITGETPDAARLRRLRIEPTLTIDKDLIFGLQYEPSDRAAPVKNLVASYTGLPRFVVTAGNFKEPFSLETLTSNNDITFMERSLADVFSPERNTGVALSAALDQWTVSAGVFGGNVNESVDRGGLAGTARVAWTPLRSATAVLHLGLAGSYRSLDRRGPEVSFATSPESSLVRVSLVDTGAIDGARSVARLGLEAAYAAGPFRLQGEYVATEVERKGGRDVAFQGGYVYGAWVLNGRAPDYERRSDIASEGGVFKRVKPDEGQRVSRGGSGVFEAALRYSAIDLTSLPVRGGFEQDVTVGLNWYPEPFVRVMANYVHAWVDRAAPTGRDTSADIGQMRLQIAF